MRLNYPVKYAILGIEEQVGLGFHGDFEYDICAYIASKVYVVGQTTEYFGDGSRKTQYQVVFPYVAKENLRKRRIPEYNVYDYCINATRTDFVFDTYEEANEVVNDKNRKILASQFIKTSNPNWVEQFKQQRAQCEEKIEGYRQFEQEIMLLMQDMIVTQDSLADIQTDIKIKKLDL